MQIETVISLLGLVVAVMLVQAITNLVSTAQDLYGKLLAGGIIYSWAREKRESLPNDTTIPTGVFNRVKESHGQFQLQEPVRDLEGDLEEEETEGNDNWNPYYKKAWRTL